MTSYGILRHVALVRTDVSEEFCASIIRMTRIGELGKLATGSSPPGDGGAKFHLNVCSNKSHMA
jgi:hypothetical protein